MSTIPATVTECADNDRRGADVFRCNRCGCDAVRSDRDGVSCSECAFVFPSSIGVPDFNTRNDFKDPSIEEYECKLSELLAASRGRPWQEALIETLGSSASYSIDERKADFLYLLDVGRDARVLDLGCGLGPITVALAREFAEVDACDRLAGNAAFTRIRAAQEGLDNVRCCAAGDDGTLPYADDVFDLVVMNGVIEWVPTTNPDSSVRPDADQLRLLREVYRTMRPGGILYMSTKNRFALQYLLGRKDEHTGLRYTTVAPQTLVRRSLSALRGHDHRVCTHSIRSLEKLLGHAGFAKPKRWALVPDFRYPSAYIRGDLRSALRTAHGVGATQAGYPRLESILLRLLPSTVANHLHYCFALEARRPEVR